MGDKYKVIDNKIEETANANAKKPIKELIDSSYQGIKRLFVLVYGNTAGDEQVWWCYFSSKSIYFQE